MSGDCLQARKGKKHTAEYKADKPLCGTWAEIDGQPPCPIITDNVSAVLTCFILYANALLADIECLDDLLHILPSMPQKLCCVL